jgi:excisionase family DNA binding protein
MNQGRQTTRSADAPAAPRSRNQSDSHQSCPAPRVIPWDEWVPEEQAAQQLGASVPTLRRMRALGKLPFTRLAGHVYYHPDDLATVLARGYGRTA